MKANCKIIDYYFAVYEKINKLKSLHIIYRPPKI